MTTKLSRRKFIQNAAIAAGVMTGVAALPKNAQAADLDGWGIYSDDVYLAGEIDAAGDVGPFEADDWTVAFQVSHADEDGEMHFEVVPAQYNYPSRNFEATMLFSGTVTGIFVTFPDGTVQFNYQDRCVMPDDTVMLPLVEMAKIA